MDAVPLRPVHDERLLRAHEVADPLERTRLVRALADAGEMVTLHAGDDDAPVVSRIVGVDAARGVVSLELVTDDARRDAIRAAGRVVAVAAPAGITVQFELTRMALVGEGPRARLNAALPARLYRLQRRDAYRASPSARSRPAMRMAVADGDVTLPVLDLSATGVALAWPADAPPPRPGATLQGCRLDLPASPPIRCVARVRSADRIETPEGPVLRVGCALDGLDPSSERAIQVWVDDAQRSDRRARPRLA
jgi:c-di-GMP-binding flagellar brake protein YcgR